MTSFDDRSAEATIGTIWLSLPWMIRVGTSNFFRSSVKSVSENALMHSYRFLISVNAESPVSDNAGKQQPVLVGRLFRVVSQTVVYETLPLPTANERFYAY